MMERLLYAEERSRPPSGLEPDLRRKRYCTFWLRKGECDFVQQGCMYKHEFPPTADEWASIGFQSVPNWIHKRSPEWAKHMSQALEQRSSKEPSVRSSRHHRIQSEKVMQRKKSQGPTGSKNHKTIDRLPSPLRTGKHASRKPQLTKVNTARASVTMSSSSASGPDSPESDLIDFNSVPPPTLAASLTPSPPCPDRKTLPPQRRPYGTPIDTGASATVLSRSQPQGDRYPQFAPFPSPEQSRSRVASSPLSPSVTDIDTPPPQYHSPPSRPPAPPNPCVRDGTNSPPQTFDEILSGKKSKTAVRDGHTRDEAVEAGQRVRAPESIEEVRRHPAEALREGIEPRRRSRRAGRGRRRDNRERVNVKEEREGR